MPLLHISTLKRVVRKGVMKLLNLYKHIRTRRTTTVFSDNHDCYTQWIVNLCQRRAAKLDLRSHLIIVITASTQPHYPSTNPTQPPPERRPTNQAGDHPALRADFMPRIRNFSESFRSPAARVAYQLRFESVMTARLVIGTPCEVVG